MELAPCHVPAQSPVFDNIPVFVTVASVPTCDTDIPLPACNVVTVPDAAVPTIVIIACPVASVDVVTVMFEPADIVRVEVVIPLNVGIVPPPV